MVAVGSWFNAAQVQVPVLAMDSRALRRIPLL
jgi:hypothetical protein